jgi:hypothetical protein
MIEAADRVTMSQFVRETVGQGVVGTFHQVSKEYLPLHLAEFSYRHNNWKNPDIIRMSLQTAEHATAEACSDEIQSEALPTPLAHGGLMPKAKPVSLFPLSFNRLLMCSYRRSRNHSRKENPRNQRSQFDPTSSLLV